MIPVEKTLSQAVKDVVSSMMGGGVTGNQAWTREVGRASNTTLLKWSRDPLTRAPGCEYILEYIQAEMKRRIDNAPPLAVQIVDYGTKR